MERCKESIAESDSRPLIARGRFRIAISILAMLLTAYVAYADERSDDSAKEELEKQKRSKEVLEHMQGITVESVTKNRDRVVALIDHPLLKYTDPARANDQGTVWAWGREGRPLALVEVFQPSGQAAWVHAITLTSTDRVVAMISNQLSWSPQTTSIEFQSFPSAATPSERETQRLAQLKELARKFEAWEFWDPDNSRFELRLLVQPVHRYRDPEKKIVDGAIFLLAHGTNPEIVLLIEAQGEAANSAQWRYGMARLGSAELHASFDGQEVWTQPRTPNVAGKPTDPYWLFVTKPKSSGQ